MSISKSDRKCNPKLIVAIFLSSMLFAACGNAEPNEAIEREHTVSESPEAENLDEAGPTPKPESQWQELARMVQARSEMPAVVLSGNIYVPGGIKRGQTITLGVDTLEVYEPSDDTWQTLAKMPAARHHLMAVAFDEYLYVFGGFGENWAAQDNVWRYSPKEDIWTQLEAMPKKIGAGAAVVLNDFVYILGGVNDGTTLLRFAPNNGEWEELAAMAHPREHFVAVVHDEKIYALAGRWHDGETNTAEVYDPSSDRWTEIASLQEARGGHAAALYNGQILVIGGEVLSSTPFTHTSVEAYDPDLNTWMDFPALPIPLHGMPAVVSEGQLYVIGGSTLAGQSSNNGFTYIFLP